MKLTLDPLDLQERYRRTVDSLLNQPTISAYQVTYQHLTQEAQAAVRVVGRATYTPGTAEPIMPSMRQKGSDEAQQLLLFNPCSHRRLPC